MTVLVSPFVAGDGGSEMTAAIRNRRPGLALEHADDEAAFDERLPDAEIVITQRLSTDVLEQVPDLEWVQALSAGTDSYDHEAFAEHDVALTNTSGVHADPIAQQVLGYLLYFERDFDRAVAQQRRREWDRFGGGELGDRTVGIVGVGAIGSRVARYCRHFDARLLGVKRDPTVAPAALEAVYAPDDLEAVLAESDYLLLSCPLTEATRGMIDADALATLPDQAVLVNVARGEVVEEDALVDALEGDELGGAALDVFEEEPLHESSTFWNREDVLITPHMAGSTPHYWERCAELFVENYERFLSGEPLENRVV